MVCPRRHVITSGLYLLKFIPKLQGTREDCGLPEFVLRLEGRISLKVCFICNSRPPTPDITSRGSPRPMRIIAVVIQDWNTISENGACEIFAYLRRQLEELCVLRVVIFTFRNYQALQKVTEQVASLREPWGNVACTYRFICEDHEDHPIPPNPYRIFTDGRPVYSDSWEIIPTTLELTGMVHFKSVIRP